LAKNKNRERVQAQSAQASSPRETVFQKEFREDLRYWARNDRQVFDKIFDLIEEITRTPFEGIGKPEPLKYDLEGCWSRRITQEHRIVYLVTDTKIDFLQARYHY
jgi:toxin YoeB